MGALITRGNDYGISRSNYVGYAEHRRCSTPVDMVHEQVSREKGRMVTEQYKVISEIGESTHFVVELNGFYIQDADANGIYWTDQLQESAIWCDESAHIMVNNYLPDEVIPDANILPVSVDMHLTA